MQKKYRLFKFEEVSETLQRRQHRCFRWFRRVLSVLRGDYGDYGDYGGISESFKGFPSGFRDVTEVLDKRFLSSLLKLLEMTPKSL